MATTRVLALPMRVSLTEMTDEALTCRVEGHAYLKINDDNLDIKRGTLKGFRRTKYCERCGREAPRILHLDSGTTERKSGHYPPGYLSSEGRISRQDALVESLRRQGYRVTKV